MNKESKATIKIPRELYRRLQMVVDRSGFDSVTDFVVFVLRDLISTNATRMSAAPIAAPIPEGTGNASPFTPEELQMVTERLKQLGYL